MRVGYIVEPYNKRVFAVHGMDAVFVQDNQSLLHRVDAVRAVTTRSDRQRSASWCVICVGRYRTSPWTSNGLRPRLASMWPRRS